MCVCPGVDTLWIPSTHPLFPWHFTDRQPNPIEISPCWLSWVRAASAVPHRGILQLGDLEVRGELFSWPRGSHSNVYLDFSQWFHRCKSSLICICVCRVGSRPPTGAKSCTVAMCFMQCHLCDSLHWWSAVTYSKKMGLCLNVLLISTSRNGKTMAMCRCNYSTCS